MSPHRTLYTALAASMLLLAPTFAQHGRPLTEEVALAVRRTEQIGVLQVRYTRLDLQTTEQVDEQGRPRNRRALLFEDTWLHGERFRKLLEDGGEALSGKALQAETRRLARAARDWRKLEQASNAPLTDVPERQFELPLRRGLLSTPAYRLLPQHRETLHGQPCHVVLAEPVAPQWNGVPVPPFRYELWINEADPQIVRLTFELQQNYGTLQKGSHGALDLTEFQGRPVDEHLFLDAFVQVRTSFQEIRTEHTYSQYQAFGFETVRPGQRPPPDTRPSTRRER